jgi:hypothetical protein
MEDWRQLASRYLAHINQAVGNSYSSRLISVGQLLGGYLWRHGFADPVRFLTLPRTVNVPSLVGAVGEAPMRHSRSGVRSVNYAHDFLSWVLESDPRFSEEDDGGRKVIPGCRVPFARLSQSRLPLIRETVRHPLPYKWIVELRRILAPGENFTDWKWAQQMTGRNQGRTAGDWYEVGPKVIDRSDPDCVWRLRQVNVYKMAGDGTPVIVKRCREEDRKWVAVTRPAYEMWSPVNAVALLLKLELPLRTYQVRMLDSGEMDSERVELADEAGRARDEPFVWRGNSRRSSLLMALPEASRARAGTRQGVFRKTVESLLKRTETCFFINTNKTADTGKGWGDRGYVISWQHTSMLRWLIKLRNWQEKYNRLRRPMLWSELETRHVGFKKSDAELAMPAPSCFLFRNAAARGKREPDTQKPITHCRLDFIWGGLLRELEQRLAESGVRDAAGGKIALVKGQKSLMTTFFPLHSLRVSLLTALAFEGGVTLQTLMQLAGHSRILMTIYYQKIGSVMMAEELEKAAAGMAASADRSLIRWLKQRAVDAIVARVVAVSEDGLREAIPAGAKDRSAAGWLRVHGGWCLVGGNTTSIDGNRQIGGCHSGGPRVMVHQRVPSSNVHEAVRPRNCIGGGCRFFVTRPEYLPEIKAKLDILLCGLSEVRRRQKRADAVWQELQREKYQAERAGAPFLKVAELDQAASVSERTATELNTTMEEIARTLRLIDRCIAVFKSDSHRRDQLVAQGTVVDIQLALETTDSELLQLSGVCHEAEIYPEMENEIGEAIMRRSQLLDQMIHREKGRLLLGGLDKEEQLRLGNRIMRELTRTFESEHPGTGLREMVATLDSGVALPPELKKTLDRTLNDAGPRLRSAPLSALWPTKRLLPAPVHENRS